MIFVPMDNDFSQPGRIDSTEFFTQLTTNLNGLLDSVPVGTVVMVANGIIGIPNPDPDMWEPCDGTLVVNQNSPIRNQTKPTMTISSVGATPFLKGSSVGTGIGGANSAFLLHNHGGFTGTNAIFVRTASGTLFRDTAVHNHVIPSDSTNNNVPIVPSSIVFNFFVKVI